MVYFFTKAPGVTAEDSGEFIVTSLSWGVAHPPGYPVFTFLGKVFSFLPVGSMAERIHFLNCCLAAGAIFIFIRWAEANVKSLLLAVLGGILLGAHPEIWRQAIVAEVYMMNLFFFAVVLGVLHRFPDSNLLLGLLFGLGLSNHWPFFLFVVGTFLLIHRGTRVFHWRFIAGALFGLLPYLVMFFRSQSEGAILFLKPIEGLGALLDYVLRAEYSNYNVHKAWGIQDSIKFAGEFLLQVFSAGGYLGFIFIPLGIWQGRQLIPRPIFMGMAAALLVNGLLPLFFWRTEYNGITIHVYRGILLVAVLLGIVFFILGVRWALQKCDGPLKKNALAGILMMGVLYNFWMSFSYNNFKGRSLNFDYARLVLESLPRNAVLFFWSDADTGPILYAQEGAGLRPDVKLVSQFGVLSRERIYDRSLSAEQKQSLTISWIRSQLSQGHRVFSTRKLETFQSRPEEFPFRYFSHGLFEEIVESTVGMNKIEGVEKSVLEIADRIIQNEYLIEWPYHQNILISRMCQALLVNHGDHGLFRQVPNCKILFAQSLHAVQGDFKKADQYFLQVLSEIKMLPVSEQVDIHRQFMINRLKWMGQGGGSNEERRQVFQEMADRTFEIVKRYPFCDNQVARNLVEIKAQVPIELDMEYMRSRFSGCQEFAAALRKI